MTLCCKNLEKILALAIFLITGWMLFGFGAVSAEERAYTFGAPIKEFEIIQLDDFCSKAKVKLTQCSRMNSHYLKFFFSVFLAIAWGGAVRTIIKTFELSIPYTVVLLMTGLGIGLGSRINTEFCVRWSQYTRFARTPPELILFIFLPVLIFESAFSMKAHVFMSSFLSIVVVALPGMLLTTFITAIGCRQFMNNYDWTFSQASLFGAIISATDPVAVVAILRELGTSEILSVMIEGESLLNDGVAILLYEIFKDIVEEADNHDENEEDPTGKIAKQFLRIAVGGPFFGWAMGKISIWCLSLIFNDAATEITITLVSAYLTYFIGEFYLSVSGVMAVVLLGVTVNAGNTCISPEVMHTVHQFWQMMSFLANTVLFILLGIVISETAINAYQPGDGVNVIWLYFALNVIRMLMLILASPILIRTGFDASWRNLTVMMWGGLRGAVGICLALEVYKNKKLCKYSNVGSKFLLQTAGIVILTLIVNGTTTKSLLDYLGVTAISIGKLQDMQNAVRNLTAARVRTIISLKHDRFLADANWEIVSRFTHLKDPYLKKRKPRPEEKPQDFEKKFQRIIDAHSIINEKLIVGGHLSSKILHDRSKGGVDPKTTENKEVINLQALPSVMQIHQGKLKRQTTGIASDLDLQIHQDDNASTLAAESKMELVGVDFKEAMEECRGRVLKTMKISCWTQYEKGSLSEEAVKAVVNAIEAKEDAFLSMIHMEDLADHWQIKGVVGWIKRKFDLFLEGDPHPPKPTNCVWLRYPCYWLTTRGWFHGLIYFIIFLNLCPIIMDMVVDNPKPSSWEYKFLFWTTMIFTLLYLTEFLLKVIGRGPKDYFSSKWNLLDFFVLIISIIEVILVLYNRFKKESKGDDSQKNTSEGIFQKLKFLRTLRFLRLLRWFRPLLPLMDRLLEYRINARLFMGYDVGKGYIYALEDALRFLPTMIPNEKIAQKYKAVLDQDRLRTVHELGMLQLAHPGVVVAVKTRHASTAISGYMKEELETMKFEGILEENEFELLNSKVDGNLKKLLATPSSINISDPEVLVGNISWAVGNSSIVGYLQENKEIKRLSKGDVLYNIGERPNGIHLIISGLLYLQYEPTMRHINDFTEKGIFPNTEFVLDMTFATTAKEYLGGGFIVGEYGFLTKLPRAAKVKADTDTVMFWWSNSVLERGLKLFHDEYDSFESRIWRSVGVRIGEEFLHTTTQYSSWSGDKIRAHLEQGVVPMGEKFKEIDIPEVIQEVILFYGSVVNLHTNEKMVAPALLPPTWSKIGPASLDNNAPQAKVMLIVHDEEIDLLQDKDSVTSLDKCILKAPGVAMSFDVEEEDPLSMLSKSGKHRRRSVFIQSMSTSTSARRKSTIEAGIRKISGEGYRGSKGSASRKTLINFVDPKGKR